MKKLSLIILTLLCLHYVNILHSLDTIGSINILSENDVKLYSKIFNTDNIKLQEKLRKQIEQPLLDGYILYFRYISDKYHSRYYELRKWLNKHYNSPTANHIYKIAKMRAGNSTKLRNRLHAPKLYMHFKPIYSMLDNEFHFNTNNRGFNIYVRKTTHAKKLAFFIKKGYTKTAKNYLKKYKHYIKKSNYYYFATKLAMMYTLDHEYKRAMYWANKVHSVYPYYAPPLFMIALIYWQRGEVELSKIWFQKILDNKSHFTKKNIEKAAYWHSRCSLALLDLKSYYSSLQVASVKPQTIYGLLAGYRLNLMPSIKKHKWSHKLKDDIVELKKLKIGRKALALLQVGLPHYADQELVNALGYILHSKKFSNDYKKTIIYEVLYLTQHYKLPLILNKLAGSYSMKYDIAHMSYPLVMYLPQHMYTLDPLLINSIIHTESHFNIIGKNTSGAVGLMQLIPTTATLVHDKHYIKYNNIYLSLPKNNVILGQKYLHRIMKNTNNLVFILAGWNGGYGYISGWKKRYKSALNDALLFIESIPFKETRNFVQRVLYNYIIYQAIYNQDYSILQQLSQSEFPTYRKSLYRKSINTINYEYYNVCKYNY